MVLNLNFENKAAIEAGRRIEQANAIAEWFAAVYPDEQRQAWIYRQMFDWAMRYLEKRD